MIRKYHISTSILAICVFIMGCKIDSHNKRNHNSSNNTDTQKYYKLMNENMEIGNVEMIYMFYDYWDGRGNITLGNSSKTITKKAKELFEDSIENLPLGYSPIHVYIDVKELAYLSEYMIENCDTKVLAKNFEDGNTMYKMFIMGENGTIECMYGDTNRVKEYFKGMINWINIYPNKEKFDDLIPYIDHLSK